jgi:undecaprenyl pyrophosphate phosphatase UppP
MIEINSENRNDFRLSMYIIITAFISSVISLLIQFFFKSEISRMMTIAIMLNTFAAALLTMPYFILLLIIVEKRTKEQRKEADDEEKGGHQ